MRPYISIVGAIALLALPSVGRATGPLGAMDDFNVLTFGDFHSSSDVEGKLAVGGNAFLSSFSVASHLNASANGTDTLVVGGNLNYTGGSVAYGNLACGGAFAGPG
jgi:choice-of-anchor A domain-containing protein